MTVNEIMEQLINGINSLESDIKKLLAGSSDMRNMARDDIMLQGIAKEIESKAGKLSEMVDMLELRSNREPIGDDDVIVVLSSEKAKRFETYKINNMEKAEVGEILNRLENNYEDIWIGEEAVFLENNGVQLELIDKGILDETPSFFDFYYDSENGVVVERTDLIPLHQTEYLLNRMEFSEVLFSTEERDMIMNYASRVEDMELVTVLANEVAEEGYGIIHGGISDMRSSAIVKELEGLTEDKDGIFEIFQLKDDYALHGYRFERLDHLNEYGLEVNARNYDLVYTGHLKGMSLDDIFEKFNLNRPNDFKGHSLSVSDIVVLKQDGKETAYYVDWIGFKEVPEFLNSSIELSYYVSECMEFPTLGEHHEQLSLKEAIRLYESIPAERMNGIKGIGINLHVLEEEEYKDLNCDVIAGGLIDMAAINSVEEFRTSTLIQEAIKALVENLPGVEVLNAGSSVKNSIAHVEALEEVNYNQIDGIINNLPMGREGGVPVNRADTSIMYKLERNKDKANNQVENRSAKTGELQEDL
ncbi:DUF4316 domain-containing protein [Lachnospiraceae bacterium OttesenSCG-928-D06]|nr:DUF4316 domain-containing protein [Lachnospiraceae bacterium OttesenSCG-928-D06]